MVACDKLYGNAASSATICGAVSSHFDNGGSAHRDGLPTRHPCRWGLEKRLCSQGNFGRSLHFSCRCDIHADYADAIRGSFNWK